MALILLTGSTGFVGRHLLDHFIQQGHQVRVLQRRPVDQQTRQGVHEYVMQSVNDTQAFSLACEGVDIVVHAGGLAHVTNPDLADQYEPFKEVNVEWTRQLAHCAFKANIQRFVFISSIGAVGNSSVSGQKLNEFTSCEPIGYYAQSKLEAELALAEVAAQFNGSYAIIRPPLVHGPNAPGNLARLAAWVRRGIPLPLAGLHNRRSLVHVLNLVKAIDLLAFNPLAHQQVFHVADARDYSTTDILIGAGKSLGIQPRLFRLPLNCLRWVGRLLGKQGMIEQLTGNLQVDCSHIKNTLGYQANPVQIEV